MKRKVLRQMTRAELRDEVLSLRKQLNDTKSRLKVFIMQNKDNNTQRYSIATTDSQRLQQVIRDYLGIDVNNNCRYRGFAEARFMYYNWMRINTKLTLNQIASTLTAIHHHSTLIHAIETHDDLIKFDKNYKNTYEEICRRMKMQDYEVVINAS